MRPVWLWMSTTGNFAFGTRCCVGDQRRPRPVVDDARRRELRLLAPAGADLGRARRALAAGVGRHDGGTTSPGLGDDAQRDGDDGEGDEADEGRADLGHGLQLYSSPVNDERVAVWRGAFDCAYAWAATWARTTVGRRFVVIFQERPTAKVRIARRSWLPCPTGRCWTRSARCLPGTRQTPGFLDTPASASFPAHPATSSESLLGSTLGPWRIVGRIGAGGMGVVYRAVRADAAFEREVALKVDRGAGAVVGRHRAVPSGTRDAGAARPSRHRAAARRRHHAGRVSRTS